MLTKENFDESHIWMLQKQSRTDPMILERAVFAFGLLEVNQAGRNAVCF